MISIWIITGVLFADAQECHLPFHIRNAKTGLPFNEHFALHVLQLPKWRLRKKHISEKDRWIYLFKEGKNMDIENPPDILKNSEEMRDVMEILNEFSENQRNYLLYQSRLEAERIRMTVPRELEKALKEIERALIEREKLRIETEKLRREAEELRRETEKIRSE